MGTLLRLGRFSFYLFHASLPQGERGKACFLFNRFYHLSCPESLLSCPRTHPLNIRLLP
uniref:Uncharacterized protein n=1 Tax=Picea sitchensis TaxID=3332 RepID=A0A6B9XY24_PICSI|nr:hypothetical protein Q903MT_gene6922 [Picea sitchensis]